MAIDFYEDEIEWKKKGIPTKKKLVFAIRKVRPVILRKNFSVGLVASNDFVSWCIIVDIYDDSVNLLCIGEGEKKKKDA